MPDIAERQWTEQDDRNTEQQPDGWPGGMPAYIDSVGRMMMGAAKRSWRRSNPYYETVGVGDSYFVEPEVSFPRFNQYEVLRLRINRANATTMPTLQFGEWPPAQIRKSSVAGIVDLAVGDLVAGADQSFWYDGAQFILSNPGTLDAAISGQFATAAQGALADGAAQKAQNLNDLADKGTAQDNLQVGAVFADVATATSATIPARNKRLRTQFYATANQTGGAHYRRISFADLGSVPTLAYFRSVDRFMPDGSTDNTNGGYWFLDETSVFLEMLAAVGSDATLDTAAFLAAAQLGRPIVLQEREYWLTPTAYPYDLNVHGLNREKSILKWIDPTGTASLIRDFSGSLRNWVFSNLTIDCNRQGHTDHASAYYAAIDLRPADGSTLVIDNVDLLNGRIIDVFCVGPTGSGESVDLKVTGSRFIDGLLSTDSAARAAQAVHAEEGVNIYAEGNYFECGVSDGVTTFGRGGIILQRPAGSTSLAWGSGYAAGNRFKNFGKAPANLGCIYFYSGHKSAIIIGNYAENVFGTAFSAKPDGGSISIIANTVDGQVSTVSGIIGMIGQGDSYTSFIGQNAVISGNTIRGAVGNCYFVDGQYQGGSATFENLIISNNVSQGGNRSLDLRNLKNAIVDGNVFRGASAGWFSSSPLSGTIRFTNNIVLGAAVPISLSGTMTDLDLILEGNTLADASGVAINVTSAVKRFGFKGNDIDGCTTAFVTAGASDPSYITDNEVAGSTAAWGKTGSYGELYWGSNRTNVDVAFSIRNLTISSGAITVFMDSHFVTVESGTADDLTQINGGREGQTVDLSPASSTNNVITVTIGGNIRLSSNFVMGNARDIFTAKKRGNDYLEYGRNDNG
jgi:hypothetical protein